MASLCRSSGKGQAGERHQGAAIVECGNGLGWNGTSLMSLLTQKTLKMSHSNPPGWWWFIPKHGSAQVRGCSPSKAGRSHTAFPLHPPRAALDAGFWEIFHDFPLLNHSPAIWSVAPGAPAKRGVTCATAGVGKWDMEQDRLARPHPAAPSAPLPSPHGRNISQPGPRKPTCLLSQC